MVGVGKERSRLMDRVGWWLWWWWWWMGGGAFLGTLEVEEGGFFLWEVRR